MPLGGTTRSSVRASPSRCEMPASSRRSLRTDLTRHHLPSACLRPPLSLGTYRRFFPITDPSLPWNVRPTDRRTGSWVSSHEVLCHGEPEVQTHTERCLVDALVDPMDHGGELRVGQPVAEETTTVGRRSERAKVPGIACSGGQERDEDSTWHESTGCPLQRVP